MGGIFSPFCFLSLLLAGGMSVNIQLSIKDPPLTSIDSAKIGVLCGMVAGITAFIFWYFVLWQFRSGFDWFFSSLAGKDLVQTTSTLLWQYGLVHFFLSVPLCVCGALLSHLMQKQ